MRSGDRSGEGAVRVLLLLGGLEAVALLVLAWWPGTGMPWPGMAFFFTAFVAYGVAAVRVGGLPGLRSTGPTRSIGTNEGEGRGGMPTADGARMGNATGAPEHLPTRRALVVVWGVAVLLRLGLLPVAPELSDDVFRYLWDGHVQLQGVNPYRYAPSDPALTGIRTAWHSLINHPEISTIYPPVTQMAFFVIALLGGGILQAKLLWVGLDLLTGWVLYRVAKHRGRSVVPVLVLYLWCPLLVVETAWNAHLEPLGLLALALLVAFGGRDATPDGAEGPDRTRRPIPAGIAAAGAALVKFAPVAALPPLLRRYGLRFGIAFLAAVALSYLPYLDAGSGLWSGLFTYVRDWRFMVGPFAILETVFPGRWPPRLAAAALVGSVIAWATWRRFSPERALFWILGAGLLLSPTIHPWYVLWILPFAALRGSGPWILLGGLVFLGYGGLGTFQETGIWPQPWWLRVLVWAPPLAWLALEGASLLRTGRLPDAGQPQSVGKAGPRQGEVTGSEED